ncbi:MAG: helix-turn-helix domain-containing protein [Dehalococcoidia bacterium]|nr:helix-turn-helix domain-containing protein [Dehalococcoidia bacterium]
MEKKRNSDLAEPLCLSVPAAARILGVSRNTGYEMARLGQLPTIRCGRRRLVVPKTALMKMLEEANEQHEKPKE